MTTIDPHCHSNWVLIGPDRTTATYIGRANQTTDVGVLRLKDSVSESAKSFYFELKLISGTLTTFIGFGTASFSLSKHIGQDNKSYGLRAADGHILSNGGTGIEFGPSFALNDVIGCGINLLTREIFFTKNGQNLGVAFRDISFYDETSNTTTNHGIYAYVSMHGIGESVRIMKDVLFDIVGFCKGEDDKFRLKMMASIPKTIPTDIMHSIIRDYMLFYGYTKTVQELDKCKDDADDVSLTSTAAVVPVQRSMSIEPSPSATSTSADRSGPGSGPGSGGRNSGRSTELVIASSSTTASSERISAIGHALRSRGGHVRNVTIDNASAARSASTQSDESEEEEEEEGRRGFVRGADDADESESGESKESDSSTSSASIRAAVATGGNEEISQLEAAILLLERAGGRNPSHARLAAVLSAASRASRQGHSLPSLGGRGRGGERGASSGVPSARRTRPVSPIAARPAVAKTTVSSIADNHHGEVTTRLTQASSGCCQCLLKRHSKSSSVAGHGWWLEEKSEGSCLVDHLDNDADDEEKKKVVDEMSDDDAFKFREWVSAQRQPSETSSRQVMMESNCRLRYELVSSLLSSLSRLSQSNNNNDDDDVVVQEAINSINDFKIKAIQILPSNVESRKRFGGLLLDLHSLVILHYWKQGKMMLATRYSRLCFVNICQELLKSSSEEEEGSSVSFNAKRKRNDNDDDDDDSPGFDNRDEMESIESNKDCILLKKKLLSLTECLLEVDASSRQSTICDMCEKIYSKLETRIHDVLIGTSDSSSASFQHLTILSCMLREKSMLEKVV